MTALSDEEILATVCRIIRSNVENPPDELKADTPLEGLRYVWPNPAQVHPKFLRRPATYGLTVAVVDEYYRNRAREPHWFFPENYKQGKIYRQIKTPQDLVDMVKAGFERMRQIESEKARRKEQEAALAKSLDEQGIQYLDFGDIMGDNVPWPWVQWMFLKGEFQEEHYLVRAIKKHLLTAKQKEALDKLGLSIEDCLNARYTGKQEPKVEKIYAAWNDKLGFFSFGH